MVVYAKTIEEVIGVISSQVLRPIVLLLFALAAVLFFWGVVEFMLNRDNEEKMASGKRHILWGLVGLLIMFAVNGIVWLLINFVASI